MNKIIILPTWILVKLLQPLLPSTHVWKNKNFTLEDWSEHSTDLNFLFGIMFWISIITVPRAVVYLIWNV